MSKPVDWLWPRGERIAVVFNVCPGGVVGQQGARHQPRWATLCRPARSTMAISRAACGVRRGIHRLLGGFADDLPYVRRFGNKSIVAIPLGTDVNDMPFMKYA
jgi:hypothetical protein